MTHLIDRHRYPPLAQNDQYVHIAYEADTP
jgi:hypothetical protein